MATLAASRPRAINTRPIRGVLWARVEGIPAAVEVGLEPGGEIHRARIHRHADVAQVTGAVPRGDIHAATEGDGEVRVIAADAGPLLESLPGRLRGAGMFGNRRRYDYGRNRRSPGRDTTQWAIGRRGSRPPGTANRSRSIGFPKGTAASRRAVHPPASASPAARPYPAGPCPSRAHPWIAGVACGAMITAAPIAKTVAIGGERNGRFGNQVVGNNEVGKAIMDAQRHDHRGRLGAVVNQFVAYTDLQLCFIQRRWSWPARYCPTIPGSAAG